jgi:hypothetical protein
VRKIMVTTFLSLDAGEIELGSFALGESTQKEDGHGP